LIATFAEETNDAFHLSLANWVSDPSPRAGPALGRAPELGALETSCRTPRGTVIARR
jgi:hypothetical protein